MQIFMENKETGLACGIDENGEVFFGDKIIRYCLPDTPENRKRVISDFYRNN